MNMSMYIPKPGNDLREVTYLLSLLPLTRHHLGGTDLRYRWELLQNTLGHPHILQRIKKSRTARANDAVQHLAQFFRNIQYLDRNPKEWHKLWDTLQSKLSVYGEQLLKFSPTDPP